MIRRVAIIGLGLIGGSLALGLKKRTSCQVVGYDLTTDHRQQALEVGAVDKVFPSLAATVTDVDLIVIATPVKQICRLLAQLSSLRLKKNVIITDVGSTKQEILEHAQQSLAADVFFIGGHPMAGSHRSGMQAADALLFENAYYVLTPASSVPTERVEQLSHLLRQATRAQIIQMDAQLHDRVVGAISHLPHMIAAGLVVQVGDYNEQDPWFHQLAASGFRDLTRIAASDPLMWRDILLSNDEEILPLLDDWLTTMQRFRQAIEKRDGRWIEQTFARSKMLREQLPIRQTHLLTPVYECYLDVEDHPGEIGKVASILGDHCINLKNIEVIENREEVLGVLRIAFQEENELKRAIAILENKGYQVYTDSSVKEKANQKIGNPS